MIRHLCLRDRCLGTQTLPPGRGAVQIEQPPPEAQKVRSQSFFSRLSSRGVSLGIPLTRNALQATTLVDSALTHVCENTRAAWQLFFTART